MERYKEKNFYKKLISSNNIAIRYIEIVSSEMRIDVAYISLKGSNWVLKRKSVLSNDIYSIEKIEKRIGINLPGITDSNRSEFENILLLSKQTRLQKQEDNSLFLLKQANLLRQLNTEILELKKENKKLSETNLKLLDEIDSKKNVYLENKELLEYKEQYKQNLQFKIKYELLIPEFKNTEREKKNLEDQNNTLSKRLENIQRLIKQTGINIKNLPETNIDLTNKLS